MRLVAGLLVVLSGPTATLAQSVVTVRNRHVLLRDDNVPPIDPYRRFFKIRVGTKQEDPAHRVVLPGDGTDGDPTLAGSGGGGAKLEVYNIAGSGELATYDLPAGRWERLPADGVLKAYAYTERNPGVVLTKIFVRPDKIYVRSSGALGYTLDEPMQGQVAVRLTLGTGVTWCAEAVGRPPADRYDHLDFFQSDEHDAPAPCPPVP